MSVKKHTIAGQAPLSVRGSVTPSSWNEEERSFDVTFATEREIDSWNWRYGRFIEVLSFEEGHVRLERSERGLPLLDNHSRWSGARGVLGKAENIKIGNKEGRARVRFSKREDVQPIVDDVRDGILDGISVGYRVYKYEVVRHASETEPAKLRAIDWEPYEVSLAPIQADINSHVRSGEAPQQVADLSFEVHDSFNSTRSTMEDPTAEQSAQEQGAEGTRNAQEPTPTPAPATEAPTPAAEDGQREAAIREAERTRVSQINALVERGLSPESAQSLIDSGATVDAARMQLLEEWQQRDAQTNPTGQGLHVVRDEQDTYRAAAVTALTARSGGHVESNDETRSAIAQFRGMGLFEMAKDSLERMGVNTSGWSKREIATAALGIADSSRGYHSSSDFPIILGETFRANLRAAYKLRENTFAPFTRRTTISDFKTITRAQLSGMIGDFDQIVEGGEYKSGSFAEGKEAYKLSKYGKKVAITWESLINDEMDAFSRIPQAFAAKARIKQANIVYSILTGNPVMNDGVALFHADHANLAGSGANPSVNSLGEARKAIRGQKDLNGDLIDLMPRYLIIGPDLEQSVRQLLSNEYLPTSESGVNPWKGVFEMIVEPRLTGNQWYAACDPSMIDTIEYAFLDGEEELFTEQRTGFDVDGLEIKARMVFAAKAIDHRGLYKNAGA